MEEKITSSALSASAKRVLLAISIIGLLLHPFGFGCFGQKAVEEALPQESSVAGPSAAPPIRIGRGTWDTGWFQAEIYRQLLCELGYQVPAPRTYDSDDFYEAAAAGEVDFWANGWFPLHNVFLQDQKIQNKLELVGYEVKAGALQGYLIDKASSLRYGITKLSDLKDPELARIFDADGDGRADLVGCKKGWGCEPVIEHHLDVYGLRDTVEHWGGEYSLLSRQVVNRFMRGHPVLFYTWTPNWTVGVLEPGEDVVWLEVPFPSLPEGQDEMEDKTLVHGVSGCPSSPCAMGWPPSDIRVVANRKFLARNPAVRNLFEAVSVPLEDIHAQNARIYEGEGSPKDFERHARRWIRDNRKKVDRWLAAAGLPPQGLSVGEAGTGVEAGDDLSIAKSTIRIATMPFEPLVIFGERDFTGFSIDLIEEMAEFLDLRYEIYGVNSLAKLMDEVERGAADMAAGGIGMTSEREHFLDFSHPFFESGLQILIKARPSHPLGEVFAKVFAALFSPQLLYVVGFVLFLLLLSAHVIWLSERRINEQFPAQYFRGIMASFWWSAVTVTTVGYGDKTPKGNAGRLFALFWMFSGFFILAYFTASVTSTVTVERLRSAIDGPGDLRSKRVAVVERSTGEDYMEKMGITARKMKNGREALAALLSEEIDAIVYDAPVLQYYASREGAGKVEVVGPLFWKQDYGIALQVGSPLRESFNRALLRLMENGKYKSIYNEWFGAETTMR